MNKTVAFYTAKWFLLWSFKFLCVGIMVVCTVFTFFLAVMPKNSK